MQITKIKKTITKDLIHRKKFLKTQLLFILIKTIFQNQNISFFKKSFFIFYKNFKLKNYSSKSKHLNVCVLTGKTKTTFKLTSFNRHISKKFLDLGLLNQFKKN